MRTTYLFKTPHWPPLPEPVKAGHPGDGLEIGTALGRIGRYRCTLEGGQQQRDQQGNDADDHQQLDEGKGSPRGR